MKNQWKKYGPVIKINAAGLNRVIAWGRKKNKVEKNDESD